MSPVLEVPIGGILQPDQGRRQHLETGRALQDQRNLLDLGAIVKLR
jgi:hypothetical protein